MADPPRSAPRRPSAGLTEGRIERRGSLAVHAWPALDGLPVDAIVTTRDGGVSGGSYSTLNMGLGVGDDAAAVFENRRRVAEALRASLDDLVFASQIHGTRVSEVDAGQGGRGARDPSGSVPDTDALLTSDPAVVLAITVADCVPILLLDPRRRLLASVHAGWRGTGAGIVATTVAAMVERGSEPSEIVAAIGPAIHPARYEVGDDVVGALEGSAGAGAERGVEWLRPAGADRWHLDLPAANRAALVACGVSAHRIVSSPWHTGGGGPFFSHREAAPTGRFALLARIAQRSQ